MALGRSISKQYFNSLVEKFRSSPLRYMQVDDKAQFAECYNREAFLIRHMLHDHPLFTLDALFDLCRRLPEIDIKCRVGSIPIDAHFDSSLGKYRGDLTLEQAIAGFPDNQAYIAIYNPENDERYRVFLEALLGEIGSHIQRCDGPINWYSTYIFISSQASVTPYHMDREMNFLFQIRGTKTAKLWSRFDDRVMSSFERDRLLADVSLDRPGYRPELEEYTHCFRLVEGLCLHHPFIAPHLISTDSAISISLAFTFRTELSDIWSDAHRWNYLWRKSGVHPAAVGLNQVRDKRKATLLRSMRQVKRPLRELKNLLVGSH